MSTTDISDVFVELAPIVSGTVVHPAKGKSPACVATSQPGLWRQVSAPRAYELGAVRCGAAECNRSVVAE